MDRSSAREEPWCIRTSCSCYPEGDLKVLLDEGDPHKSGWLEQAFFNNHVTEDVLL